jgi:hypothetical protein
MKFPQYRYFRLMEAQVVPVKKAMKQQIKAVILN